MLNTQYVVFILMRLADVVVRGDRWCGWQQMAVDGNGLRWTAADDSGWQRMAADGRVFMLK